MESAMHGREIKTREHGNANIGTTMHGNREHNRHANTETGTGNKNETGKKRLREDDKKAGHFVALPINGDL